MPLWGSRTTATRQAPRRALERVGLRATCTGSRRSVTAGAPTMYDAVERVQRYLNRNFSYSEKPRAARYPLNAFLFRDKFGYCQQFSGAMALMLRMAGHPQSRGGRVRARLAQPRHGRVPRARPRRPLLGRGVLQRHRLGHVRPDAGGGAGGDAVGRRDADQSPPAGRSTARARGSPRRTRGAAPAARSAPGLRRRRVGLAAAAAGCCSCAGGRGGLADGASHAPARSARSWPRRSWQSCAARCAGSSWEVPAGTTLLGLERRLGRAAGPAAARYAAALRAHRYDPRSPDGADACASAAACAAT